MSAVWAVVRTGLGRRAGTTVVLALLVAVATGTVVASVAGARRTDSAMDRFVAFSRPEDVYVQAPDSVTAEKVAALPHVADSDRFPFVFLTRTPDGADAGSVVTFGRRRAGLPHHEPGRRDPRPPDPHRRPHRGGRQRAGCPPTPSRRGQPSHPVRL